MCNYTISSGVSVVSKGSSPSKVSIKNSPSSDSSSSRGARGFTVSVEFSDEITLASDANVGKLIEEVGGGVT